MTIELTNLRACIFAVIFLTKNYYYL